MSVLDLRETGDRMPRKMHEIHAVERKETEGNRKHQKTEGIREGSGRIHTSGGKTDEQGKEGKGVDVEEKLLKQYRHLVMEIKDIDRRIISHNRAEVQRDTVRGGYGGTQHFDIEGQPDKGKTLEKSRLQMEILQKKKKRAELEARTAAVEAFIDAVDDSRMRQILRLRYMDGMSWNETAKNIGEFGQGDAVRISCSRFLRKYKQ